MFKLTEDDWRIPLDDHIVAWADDWMKQRGLAREDRRRPLVAVQLRGSGQMKALPDHVMQTLVMRLADDDYDLLLLEPDHGHAMRYVTQRGGIYESSGIPVMHMIALMRHLDVAVVMDSGPLWMAHNAPCPIVAILGPTHADQRISMHPYYPHRARAVALNEIIDCEACFEKATACQGKFTCMQSQPNWEIAYTQIRDATAAVLNSEASISLEVVQ